MPSDLWLGLSVFGLLLAPITGGLLSYGLWRPFEPRWQKGVGVATGLLLAGCIYQSLELVSNYPEDLEKGLWITLWVISTMVSALLVPVTWLARRQASERGQARLC